jgi:hypothetical protein
VSRRLVFALALGMAPAAQPSLAAYGVRNVTDLELAASGL